MGVFVNLRRFDFCMKQKLNNFTRSKTSSIFSIVGPIEQEDKELLLVK